MKPLLPALFFVLALPLALCSAEETKASENPNPLTRIYKISDFETKGNWMAWDAN